MKVINTSIPGVIKIQPKVHLDQRGYFFESFKTTDFLSHGLPTSFVQDNQAKSAKGVLRGLHYQLKYPQGKLVWVSKGKILDVAVDIRQNSPTFGQYESAVLDDEDHTRFYIPPGFAHGYFVISDSAIFQYKCTEKYYPDDEYGISWSDKTANIQWPVNEPILTDKDMAFPQLADQDESLLPEFEV